jgi:hypothetical protein
MVNILNPRMMEKTAINESWNPISNIDKGLISKEINPANPKEFRRLTFLLTKNPRAKTLYIITALTVEELAPVSEV